MLRYQDLCGYVGCLCLISFFLKKKKDKRRDLEKEICFSVRSYTCVQEIDLEIYA